MSKHNKTQSAAPGPSADISRSPVAYKVWDRTTRWFHWINVLCVICLAMLGLAILNEKSFGVSAEGKILLKTLHVYVGYVFAINLGVASDLGIRG